MGGRCGRGLRGCPFPPPGGGRAAGPTGPAGPRRTGNLPAAAAAAASAESLLHDLPYDKLGQHPEIRAEVLCHRGAVEAWSGHFDEAARTLRSGVTAATTTGGEGERADCLGHLAL